MRPILLLGGLLTALLLPPPARAAQPIPPPPLGETNVVAAVAEPPKSVFNGDLTSGIDPFFPKSTRLLAKPSLLASNLPPVFLKPMVPAEVQLQGISLSRTRRLALINNRTVEAGEEFTVRVGGEPVKVRCEEVRDRSVVVSVRGVTKEIPLRKKLQ